MTDLQIKTGAAQVECPHIENPAFARPKPVAQCRVAIVTSASMHRADDVDFAPTDTGFRTLDADRRDIVVGHWSPNFDAVGVAADLNVVFPIDRLQELADNGTIGDSTDTTIDGIWEVLAPGDEISLTAQYIVTQADVDNLQ